MIAEGWQETYVRRLREENERQQLIISALKKIVFTQYPPVDLLFIADRWVDGITPEELNALRGEE